MSRTVVLVPRRSDGGRRDEVWEWVQSWWARHHPDLEVIEGHDTGSGKFNRSMAINDAARIAGKFDLAVIGDADSIVGPEQILAAIAAAPTYGFVLAYDQFSYLKRWMTDKILAGHRGSWLGEGNKAGIEWTMTGTCSSMLVVTRKVWRDTEGFDEGFVGWGFEDIAFSHKAQTFAGGLHRIEGRAWHLWHPPSAENNHRDPVWLAGKERMERYAACAYNPQAMRRLMAEMKETSA